MSYGFKETRTLARLFLTQPVRSHPRGLLRLARGVRTAFGKLRLQCGPLFPLWIPDLTDVAFLASALVSSYSPPDQPWGGDSLLPLEPLVFPTSAKPGQHG